MHRGAAQQYVKKEPADPPQIRCGCFLPDLTKLADANVRPTPGAAYAGKRAISQVGKAVLGAAPIMELKWPTYT